MSLRSSNILTHLELCSRIDIWSTLIFFGELTIEVWLFANTSKSFCLPLFTEQFLSETVVELAVASFICDHSLGSKETKCIV